MGTVHRVARSNQRYDRGVAFKGFFFEGAGPPLARTATLGLQVLSFCHFSVTRFRAAAMELLFSLREKTA